KGLTTLSQPLHRMGMTAFDILLDDIENKPTQKKQQVFYPELIIRETTGAWQHQVIADAVNSTAN
ncbi:MAG: LacI family transcriptional regulator, partial [Clostridiales bacterium]|nr:LacI family transcriptional regulator [Clostridiales bacterium]